MFPQCYFNCFNPYYREAMMDYNSSDTSGSEYLESRQQKPTTKPEPQPIIQQQDFEQAPGSPTFQDILYTQGYLKTQIGKRVKIFFLIGTNLVQDREGILLDVGISYVILREIETNYKILCDIYSIKFVTIYP
jgi:hypothetical protein